MTATIPSAKPTVKPACSHFSSGPCAKRPGWSFKALEGAFLARSHRAKDGKAKLKLAIEKTKSILGVPAGFHCAIVPASDTGAYEMAMWTMLGARPVTALAWESFGEGWVTDVVKQLKLKDAKIVKADYGHLPDLSKIDFSHDVLFTANGTTSGVRIPNYDWIPADRQGLTFVDATSAAFAQHIDWAKADVVTFSWQKALGGEAAHGMLILSPRAVARLESYTPAWPLPKIFRLTKGGKFMKEVFEGDTINTPSMMCVEDYLDALSWAEAAGGLKGLVARADANARAVFDWIEKSPGVANLAVKADTRSNTSVCLKFTDPAVVALSLEAQTAFAKQVAGALDKEGVAYDIAFYRDAPPGLRIWCGSTVETSDVKALLPWIDWAYAQARAGLTKG
jgi:phosphoserine aminotransferase